MKEYLSRQSVPFRELDVSRDSAAAAEMVRLSGQQGVPVTTIGGQTVVGFDRQRLDAILAQARRPRLGAAVAEAADMAAKGRCQATRGAFVGRVTPGGVAERAGLEAGDVIESFASQALSSSVHLERLLAGIQPGHTVPVEFMRGAEQLNALLSF